MISTNENAVAIKSNNGSALTGGLTNFPKLSNSDEKTKLYFEIILLIFDIKLGIQNICLNVYEMLNVLRGLQ